MTIRGLFVSGTGTDVGKTVVTAGVARLLSRRGVLPAVVKPVQTGAARDGGGRLFSPDLEFVRSAASLPPPGVEESLSSPYLFEPSCSPHLAARLAGEPISAERISEAARLLSGRHPFLLVEGAGGVLVPIGGGLSMADLALRLSLPVLLVGHGGLGTLNHVLLSLEALRSRGVPVLGVVLNDVARASDADAFIRDDNAAAIEEIGGVTVAARVPWLGSPPELGLLDDALERSRLPALLDGASAAAYGEGAAPARAERRREGISGSCRDG